MFLRTIVACLALVLAMPLCGCSGGKKKEAEEDKPVVQEMNIPGPDDANKKSAKAKEDEIESLPFDDGQNEEEELPELGSGS